VDIGEFMLKACRWRTLSSAPSLVPTLLPELAGSPSSARKSPYRRLRIGQRKEDQVIEKAWFRRVRKRLRKWPKKTKSPKTGVLGLFVSVLLVALKLTELVHQLASVSF
jgi:hypothetical protein